MYLIVSVCILYVLYMFLLLNTSCSLFSRHTLAGVNAVKEVQVTGDMTDCTEKNGPPQKCQYKPNSTICHPGVSWHPVP